MYYVFKKIDYNMWECISEAFNNKENANIERIYLQPDYDERLKVFDSIDNIRRL